jgi:hypothetical protein
VGAACVMIAIEFKKAASDIVGPVSVNLGVFESPAFPDFACIIYL